MILKFIKDDTGATAIEYSLIAGGIAVAIVATAQGLGVKVTSLFTTVKGAFG